MVFCSDSIIATPHRSQASASEWPTNEALNRFVLNISVQS